MPVSSRRRAADVASCDALLDDATLARAVRDATCTLPRHLRTMLYLTDVEELSYGQAAEVMGTSAYAVASELRTARGWLRARLGPSIRQAAGELAARESGSPARPGSAA